MIDIVTSALMGSPWPDWPIWLATAFVAVWALARSSNLGGAGRLRSLIVLTPWITVIAFLLLTACVVSRHWAAAGLSALALVLFLKAVVPRAIRSSDKEGPAGMSLTVLSANLYYGRADPDALLALVDRLKPDLLNLQEIDQDFVGEMRRLGLERRLPYSVTSIQDGYTGVGPYGACLFGRLPLKQLSRSSRTSGRMLPALVELSHGGSVRVINFHPCMPIGIRSAAWETELRDLPSPERDRPSLLVGDFNATLDQVELRRVLARGYRDAAEVTGNGLRPTWPTNRAYPPLVTLDHVLADRRFRIVDYRVEDLIGSDHRAVYANLLLEDASSTR